MDPKVQVILAFGFCRVGHHWRRQMDLHRPRIPGIDEYHVGRINAKFQKRGNGIEAVEQRFPVTVLGEDDGSATPFVSPNPLLQLNGRPLLTQVRDVTLSLFAQVRQHIGKTYAVKPASDRS